MKFTKYQLLVNPRLIPKIANAYIYDVLADDNYSNNTSITVDEIGGLAINRPWTIAITTFSPNLPRYQRITCPQCLKTIVNAYWLDHTQSHRHVKKVREIKDLLHDDLALYHAMLSLVEG